MTSPEAFARPESSVRLSRRQLLAGCALLGTEVALGGCTTDDEHLGPPVSPQVAQEKKEVQNVADLLQAGPWQYMAGAKPVAGGLELTPTNLSIINKRQTGQREPNPPLNVYGPHLQVEGNFSLSAHLQSRTPITLQLYGKLPQRFDDFRYERARVACTVEDATLTVQLWNGSQPAPSTRQSFSFGGSLHGCQLQLRRQGDQLRIVVNKQTLGQLPVDAAFDTGEIWIGLSSEQGPALVKDLQAQAVHDNKLELVDTSSLHVAPMAEGLQTLVRKPGFRIGAAAALSPLVSDARYAQLFLGGELGSITPENAMKPQDVQPREGVFTFGEADALVQLAARHGLAVHGHTLMYDRAMPGWMEELPTTTTADKRRGRDVLEHHIYTTAQHFKGRVASWDVVNEVIAGFNDEAHLHDNVWLQTLGEEYIDVAFRAAHQADPAAKLFINDFGLETNPQGRGAFMFELVRRLLARGVPIHGVGMQGHVYDLPRDAIDPGVLQREMAAWHDLGLEVRITELDVTGADGAKTQARQYRDVLEVCLKASNCTGLSIWGLDDSHGSTAQLAAGRLEFGDALPYTTDYRPKLARQAMLDVLRA